MSNLLNNRFFIVLLISIIIFLAFTGCSSDLINDKLNEDYELSESTYQDGETSMSYPQIIGLSNNSQQAEMNRIIEREVLNILEDYDTENRIEIDYEIMLKSPNLLSIVYSGIHLAEDAAYPNQLFYTTTIDIDHGKVIKLKDIIKIDEKFVNLFNSSSYTPWEEELKAAAEYVWEEARGYELGEMLNHSDAYSYLTKDSLGISIAVSHAIGDHAEFEIEYKDIGIDNRIGDIWNELSSAE